MLKGYPIKITRGTINSYSGELYLGNHSLYFIPKEKENVLKTGLKRGTHKAIFGVHTTAKHNEKLDIFELSDNITEKDLDKIIESNPDALKFEAAKIDKIQHNWIRRVIKYNGKNHGLSDGISKELRKALKPWAEKNNVLTKGF